VATYTITMSEISEWLRWFDRLLKDIPKLFDVLTCLENNLWVLFVIFLVIVFIVSYIGILCSSIRDLKKGL